MPLPRLAPAATALLAALLLPAAHAQVTGSVQVNWQSLVITVTDTNPVDGIEAGFQWDWQQTSAGSFVDGTGSLPESSLHDDWTSSGGFSAVRAGFSTQGAYDAETLFVTSSATGGPQVSSRVSRQGRMLFIGEGRVDASVAMQAQVATGAGQQDAWAYADANLLFADSNWNALSAVDYARADLMNGGSMATTLTATLGFRHGEAARLQHHAGLGEQLGRLAVAEAQGRCQSGGHAAAGARARQLGPAGRRAGRAGGLAAARGGPGLMAGPGARSAPSACSTSSRSIRQA